MNEKPEALDRIIDQLYHSYLKAVPYFAPDSPDALRRSPELLSPWLGAYSGEGNIVVTGSKGKGSLARMLAALLGTMGRTGLFISPHVTDFLERIAINGEQISKASFIRYAKTALEDAAKVERGLPQGAYVSPVGILALIAMRYFTDQQTVWRVLECGKGAKYDDVNRIPHRYAVIGTVFLEHTRELGASIEQIAADKAHVITKETRCVYVMEQEPAVSAVISEHARQMGVEAKWYGNDFSARGIRQDVTGLTADLWSDGRCYPRVHLPLLGSYQAKHAALALACFTDIAHSAPIPPEWRKALGAVRIPGRMEIVSEEPFVLLDSCIHEKSAKEVRRLLEELGIGRVVTVLCLPDDKDFIGVAGVLHGVSERVILTKIRHPHYPMVADQRRVLEQAGIGCEFETDFSIALHSAKASGLPIVLLTANTFVNYAKEAWRAI